MSKSLPSDRQKKVAIFLMWVQVIVVPLIPHLFLCVVVTFFMSMSFATALGSWWIFVLSFLTINSICGWIIYHMERERYLPLIRKFKGLCPHCGYDWRGMFKCPECGSPHSDS